MRPYLAHIKINLKLTLRDRLVLFFNYAFPLAFFFIFAQTFGATRGGVINQVVAMVLIIGVLGNGLFGAGIRAVQERDQNILRRFKVAPTSPAPMLVASLVTGWLHYLPAAMLMLFAAHVFYGMPVPPEWPSLFVLLTVGIVAFRAIGLIIASVVNSPQESQIVIQLFYLPMLFLSGATFPTSVMPTWVQIVAQFLPASYMFTGMQGILVQRESLAQNFAAVAALALTTVLALLLSVKLFRWEKEEKIRGSAKLWLAAVLAPFLVLGAWQAYSRDNIRKSKVLARDLRRSHTLLIRDARIVTGDGRVIDSGAVLVRNGKIEEIYEGKAPDSKTLKADAIEGSGKTLLPGLIDAHVHLAAPGGFPGKGYVYEPEKALPRALAAYLYSGVVAVRSAGDPLDMAKRARALVSSGERAGAELFLCGPLFTTAGGHGTEYFKDLPESLRAMVQEQTVRLPKTADEARSMVVSLKGQGVDAIKAVLDSGGPGALFNRMDTAVLRAIVEEARRQGLPVAVHTGDAADVRDALAAGASSIEHGSDREAIPDELFKKMAAAGVVYDPTLSVLEAFDDLLSGNTALLDRSLVQQVGPAAILESTRTYLLGRQAKAQDTAHPVRLPIGKANLRRAYELGVPLVAGTDSGNPLLIHGPAIHRELRLWVDAGVPARTALEAATFRGARLLGAGGRMGSIRKGYEATLLLVDGNPIEEIASTERISVVLVQGEVIDRPDLFDQR